MTKEPKMIQRGAIVRYAVRAHEVEARVLSLHRDGDATVEPRFFVGEDGKTTPGFIGGKVRLPVRDLRARA